MVRFKDESTEETDVCTGLLDPIVRLRGLDPVVSAGVGNGIKPDTEVVRSIVNMTSVSSSVSVEEVASIELIPDTEETAVPDVVTAAGDG